MITLACLDLAGTTVTDDGVVEAAFRQAVDNPTDNDIAYVRSTMGMSKIVVFRNLLDGDEAAAQAANERFEKAYLESLELVTPIEGAVDAIYALRMARHPRLPHDRVLRGDEGRPARRPRLARHRRPHPHP